VFGGHYLLALDDQIGLYLLQLAEHSRGVVLNLTWLQRTQTVTGPQLG
jgi:hypothetical protein